MTPSIIRKNDTTKKGMLAAYIKNLKKILVDACCVTTIMSAAINTTAIDSKRIIKPFARSSSPDFVKTPYGLSKGP